jgi:hypothetical protein
MGRIKLNETIIFAEPKINIRVNAEYLGDARAHQQQGLTWFDIGREPHSNFK